MKKNIYEEQSFYRFLADYTTRSFEAHNWLTEAINEAGLADIKNVYALNSKQLKLFQRLYLFIVNKIYASVRVDVSGKLFEVSRVNYHSRFGWVVSSVHSGGEENEAKAFLGKMELLGNTSIVIGKRTYFSGPSLICGGGSLRIGSFSNLAENLAIYTGSDAHPMNHAAMMNLNGNSRLVEDGLSMQIAYPELSGALPLVEIGSDVWIGRNVSVKTGVKIGNGCVIGERSLINRDCKPFGVYAGTPARLIRFRFEKNVIESLTRIKWWDWSMSKIKENNVFFGADLVNYKGNIDSLIT